MTPDINVLVAAARTDHTHHARARQWLEQALSSGREITLLPMVVTGFLRIVTHPKIFVQPTSIKAAIAHVDALCAMPQVHVANDALAWQALKGLCLTHELTDNALPDAWIAACVMHLNEHLITFDRSFRRLLKGPQLTVLA